MKWISRMLVVTMLAVCMINCVPTAQAADTFSDDGFKYKVTGRKTVEIIGYDGSDSEPTISSSVDKYDIVGIADSAFKGNKTIEGFSIWADLEYIGDYAFYGCTNLVEFSIPSDMETIGESAFEGCINLSDVTFWGGESIGKAAFKGCTNLIDISIPSEMITIGESAFEDCVNLTDVTFWGGESIGKKAFKNCISLVDISIPSDMETIGESAFEGCTGLKDITFWGGERIEKNAFKNCTSLTSLSFPSDMESIGDSAFAGCTNLTNYSSWNDEMEIAANAFAGCPLGSSDAVIQAEDVMTEDAEVNTDEESVENDFQIAVHINFIPNLIFSTYDVEMMVNGEYEETLTHGEDADFILELNEGNYTFEFSSAEDSSVFGQTELDVTSDIDVSYRIACYSDEVRVEVEYIDRKTELAENEVKLLSDKYSFIGENFEDVVDSLESLGFTNITTVPVYDINFGITPEESVKNVTIDGIDDYTRGYVFLNDIEVVVTYHMSEEDNPANKVTPTPTVNSTPIPTPTPTEEPILLQKGSKGEDVRNVQLRLIELGYLKGVADGDYGNQTKAAVEAFQKASSLEVTGIITNIDMAKLFASQSTSAVNEPAEVSGNLTVKNCELLANMLQAKNPGNLVGQFMTKYKGRTIEFDGNIAYMSNHDGYKTRYDILILYGDYSTTSATGPYFQFRDVNYYDLELTGHNQPDSVHMGQNYHIVAEVVRYDSTAELIILKPVSMELR